MEILLWIVFAVLMGSMLLVAVSVVIAATRENRIYSAEARTWERLAQTGIPAQAVVESLKRSENELSRGGSQGQTVYAVELALRVLGTDAVVEERRAVVRTLIDEGLLPQFAVPGKPVHLLRDPNDASIFAIDRARTPLEIPRASH
ncbi:hypothetical protein APR50_03300 [Variovorax paradoxus]|jgi:hypothetical protein|uniref:hypothetical protein n=1 Tax=Variovorax TaxID=34072 RepID=UPI0006E614AA|nr:hypothetical protein [Variovorax sp.]KPU89120.1 hypothetical protein APR52_39735 [Variovorax paradoxus]KPV03995.1 hypothetical protein APR49_25210 [Variovorax paradoxus]KPV04010.1 hypothetical protein APR49_25285 [Variovorax paradoxus]KPV11459.1 hypothetical protein APR50_03300 [Variovorax paradoxus]KPV19880.1 hypothetical protein APR51_19120 [Variovorax paradoxus]